eukprot:TRINITY_DN9345_c0_g1_i2.p1 TRINITY_DN9345_c0_g1~~TRINITY_DN9345_c0_g1_i2.p1  ORF type:complete len:160 (-),score=25.51 TRINITY_DN9345_c0_g1_i2:58-537(-)
MPVVETPEDEQFRELAKRQLNQQASRDKIPGGCTRPVRVRRGSVPLKNSVRHFLQFCGLACFREITIVLIFTEWEKFSESVVTHPLHDVFPSYAGGPDPIQARDFLLHTFLSCNTVSSRKIISFFHTDNGDPNIIVDMLTKSVKNVVLEKGLRYASIIV